MIVTVAESAGIDWAAGFVAGPDGDPTALSAAPHPESTRKLTFADEPAISLPTQEVSTWLAELDAPPPTSRVPFGI